VGVVRVRFRGGLVWGRVRDRASGAAVATSGFLLPSARALFVWGDTRLCRSWAFRDWCLLSIFLWGSLYYRCIESVSLSTLYAMNAELT
jgi:hypothetical protein